MTKAEGGRNGHKPADAELRPDTKVTIGGRNPQAHHGYVNPPVYHASTLLYRTAEDYVAGAGRYNMAAWARRPRRLWKPRSGRSKARVVRMWRCCPPDSQRFPPR